MCAQLVSTLGLPIIGLAVARSRAWDVNKLIAVPKRRKSFNWSVFNASREKMVQGQRLWQKSAFKRVSRALLIPVRANYVFKGNGFGWGWYQSFHTDQAGAFKVQYATWSVMNF